MQPGPPYPHPPQQPPMGQPQPGYPPPPYPQQPYPQAGPQQGYPQPGYQQGYPPPQFAGPSGPRKPRTGLIVGIVVAVVVVLGGGGTAAFLLLHHSGQPDQRVGRYTTQPACSKLDAPPYQFTGAPSGKPDAILDELYEQCRASLGGDSSDASAVVTVSTFLGPGGLRVAQNSFTSLGKPVSGHGFENPVDVSYQSDNLGQRCNFGYYRSNELVSVTFYGLTGVRDQASCLSTGLPIVSTLYPQIG